jgi:transcriptional regulator NrdR family protein
MANKLCPLCKKGTKCLDSRPHEDYVRRRYECTGGHRYSTIEAFLGMNMRGTDSLEQWKNNLRAEGREALRAELALLLQPQHSNGSGNP